MYSTIDMAALPNYAFNNFYTYATATHSQVMKLHDDFSKLYTGAELAINDTDSESLKIMKRDGSLIKAAQFHVVMERSWR